jgi:hypothetical protein
MKLFPLYGIEAKWGACPEAPKDIGVKVLEMIRRLQPLAPAKSHWKLVDMSVSEGLPLPTNELEMTALVQRNVIGADLGEPDPDEGYTVVAIGSETEGDSGAGDDVHVAARIGSKSKNVLRFQIGDIRHATNFNLVTYQNYKSALQVLASTWPCPWAFAYAFDTARPPKRGRTAFDFAWIAYLSAPLAEGLATPAGILSELTPGGGRLLRAADDVIDLSEVSHRRNSRTLAAILAERVGATGQGLADVKTLPPRVGQY